MIPVAIVVTLLLAVLCVGALILAIIGPQQRTPMWLLLPVGSAALALGGVYGVTLAIAQRGGAIIHVFFWLLAVLGIVCIGHAWRRWPSVRRHTE